MYSYTYAAAEEQSLVVTFYSSFLILLLLLCEENRIRAITDHDIMVFININHNN